MQLYLARHTESTYNVKQLMNSDPGVNVSLTSKGIRQAHELANKLRGKKFDVIYISKLPRTKQTADIVNDFHKLPVIKDARLNDNASGFEGRPMQEFLKAFNASGDKWGAKFNDGESLEDAKNRVGEFLEDLRKSSYASVLIVTHGYVIECIYGILNKLSFDQSSLYSIPQGDYAVFDII